MSGQELRRFFGGGEGADDVEVGAPQEDFVGAGTGGLDGELFPAIEDDFVDFAARRQRRGGLEGSDGRAVRSRSGKGGGQYRESKGDYSPNIHFRLTGMITRKSPESLGKRRVDHDPLSPGR